MVTCQIIAPDDADVYIPGPVPGVEELRTLKNKLAQQYNGHKVIVVAMQMDNVEDDFNRVGSVFHDAELFHVIMCLE